MTMLVCAWYLQCTRHILPLQIVVSSSSVTKKSFPPSSVDQFLRLIFYSIKTTNLHLWLWFSLHFQLIVECLKLQREWWHNKSWVFVTFFGWKYAKCNKLTLLLTANYIPCLLPLMEVEGQRDRSWQGQKWPCFSSRCVRIRRFAHFTNWGENGYFFSKGRGCWAIGGSGHLALIVPRGGAWLELSEPPCLVSSLEPDSVDAFSPRWWAFFCAAWFSLYSTTHARKKIGQCSCNS